MAPKILCGWKMCRGKQMYRYEEYTPPSLANYTIFMETPSTLLPIYKIEVLKMVKIFVVIAIYTSSTKMSNVTSPHDRYVGCAGSKADLIFQDVSGHLPSFPGSSIISRSTF
jgi:hypothetical protein